jgi:hypothetical protein
MSLQNVLLKIMVQLKVMQLIQTKVKLYIIFLGLVRNYNEDRVSIILNIMKPINR